MTINFYKDISVSKKEEFQKVMDNGVWTNVFDHLKDSRLDLVCKKWKNLNSIIKEKELTKASKNYLFEPLFPSISKEIKDKTREEKIKILKEIPQKTFSGLKRVSNLYYEELNKTYGNNTISYKKILEANKKIELIIQNLISTVFTSPKEITPWQIIQAILKKNKIYEKLNLSEVDIKITAWDILKNSASVIMLLKNLKKDDFYKLFSQDNIIWMKNAIINEKKEINLSSIYELLKRISK